jgi:hypothetical protein
MNRLLFNLVKTTKPTQNGLTPVFPKKKQHIFYTNSYVNFYLLSGRPSTPTMVSADKMTDAITPNNKAPAG